MANIPKYDRDKFYWTMEVTQANYANQLRRLSKDGKRADFILIYYSLAIFVYTLSGIIYPGLINEDWASYAGLILSVIVLVYSIINSKAGYPERIAKIQNALNAVKRIRRETGNLPKEPSPPWPETETGNPACCSIPCNDYKTCYTNHFCVKLETLKREYDEIVGSTEARDDLDFYYTVRSLCKQYKLDLYTGSPQNGVADDLRAEELRGYIIDIRPRFQQFHVFFLHVCNIILYIVPIVIFAAGVVVTRFPDLVASLLARTGY